MATVTKTIGTASRDYSTIALWAADLDDSVIYSAGDDAVGECYNDSTFDETTSINGGGTVGLNSVTMTVPSAERHDGTAGTGARLVRTTYADGLDLDTDVTATIEWFEIDNNSDTSGGADQTGLQLGSSSVLESGGSYTARNVLVHGQRGNFSHRGIYANAISDSTGRSAYILNCIVYGIHKSFGSGADNAFGIDNDLQFPVSEIANCTVVDTEGFGSGEAIGVLKSQDNDSTIQNVISMDTTHDGGGTANDFDLAGTGGTTTQDHNLSSDATASGTGSLTSKSSGGQFVSTTVGSEDLHLKSGADAIDAGDDLGTTPSGVEIDIDGRDRDAEADTWDIGADEFVAGGGGGAVLPKGSLGLMGVGISLIVICITLGVILGA